MKYLLSLFLSVALVTPAFAAYVGSAGMTSNVRQVIQAGGYEPACMKGYLIDKVPGRKSRYTFQDKTGVMHLTIDEALFSDTRINEHTRVRICGKLDYAMALNNQFDVENVSVVK